MSDRTPDHGSSDEPGAEPERSTAAGASRWATALGIALVVGAVVLFFVLHLSGAVGPGAH